MLIVIQLMWLKYYIYKRDIFEKATEGLLFWFIQGLLGIFYLKKTKKNYCPMVRKNDRNPDKLKQFIKAVYFLALV